MVEEPLKPTVIALNGKLITSQDPLMLDEGDFHELTNMRYGDTTPCTIAGMVKFNSAAIIDATYFKSRSGFHFRKDTPRDITPPAEEPGAPWLDGWTYRKSITLTSSGGAVTNYQMKLKVGESSGATGEDVDCGGNCNSDFSDLRFTTSDAETTLDYWIETTSGTTPNQLATVWIEFDSIGTSATTFYMYYGNAGASSASSGNATFIEFDDFERGSNGDEVGYNWTEVQGAASISTDHAYNGTRSMKVSGGSTVGRVTIPQTVSANIAINFKIWKENAAYFYMVHGNGTERAFLQGETDEDISYYDGSFIDTTDNMTADAWVEFELENFNFSAGTFDIYYQGSIIHSGATTDTSALYSNQVMFQGGGIATVDIYVDCYFVRNWTATTPTWGSWGSETTES